MRYQGSEAYQLDAYQAAPARRPLSVMEGGGLDARARQGVSAPFVGLVRAVVALTVALVVVGGVRVGITAATVSCLREVSAAEATVAEARVTRTELQVERSALSSADRIQRIATENYGMTYASDVDTITLPHEVPSADDAQAAADADAA